MCGVVELAHIPLNHEYIYKISGTHQQRSLPYHRPAMLRNRKFLSPLDNLSLSMRSQVLRSHMGQRYESSFTRPTPAPPSLDFQAQKEWQQLQKHAETKSQDVYFHPDVRRKPKPEFEGERNPVTGELNGPKNDPLRHGDYSYGGRCTDF